MGASLDGPAFTFLSGNQVKVLSPEKFIKRIRECLRSVEGAGGGDLMRLPVIPLDVDLRVFAMRLAFLVSP